MLTREKKAQICEVYANSGSWKKASYKSRVRHTLAKHVISNYRGYIEPSKEKELITIPSVLNFDENYYEELFKRFNNQP